MKQLEEDYATVRRGPGPHNCLLQDVGMCVTCEPYRDMVDEIWRELQTERQQIPGYLEAQSKSRLACTCREMDQPTRIDLYTRIVWFAKIAAETRDAIT